MGCVTTSAGFDDLTLTQRLTLFTFAILTQPIDIHRKEVLAEGLFQHLQELLEAALEEKNLAEVENRCLPLLCHADHADLFLSSIRAADGSAAPILPHEPECGSLVVGHEVAVPSPEQDKNPYTILSASRYGESTGDGLRRILVVGVLTQVMADYYGTESMMVVLDFDLEGEDAPCFYELPYDLGQALTRTLLELPELTK